MEANKRRIIFILLCALAAAVILGITLFFVFRGSTGERDDPGNVDPEQTQTMPGSGDDVQPTPGKDGPQHELSNPVYREPYVPYDMVDGMYRLVGGESYVNGEGKACYSAKTNELIYWAFGSNGLFRSSVDFEGADKSLHAILTAIGNGSMFNVESGKITAIYVFPGTTEDTKKDLSTLPEGAVKDIDVVIAINPSTSSEAGMATATNTGLLLPNYLTSFKVFLDGDYVLENNERTPTFLTRDNNGLIVINTAAGEGASARIFADLGDKGYRAFTITLLRDGTIEIIYETTVEAASQGSGNQGGGSSMTGAPVPDGVYTWTNGRLRCAETGVILMKNDSLGWMIINGGSRNLVDDSTVITVLETLSVNDAVEIVDGKVARIIKDGSVNTGGGQGGGGQGGGMTGAPVPDGVYTWTNGRLRCADTGVILMKNETLGWMIINGENRNLIDDQSVIDILEALPETDAVEIRDGRVVEIIENGSVIDDGGGQGGGMTGAPVPDGVYTWTNGRLRCADTGVILMKNETLGWMIINGDSRNLIDDQSVIDILEALPETDAVEIKDGRVVEIIKNGSVSDDDGDDGSGETVIPPDGTYIRSTNTNGIAMVSGNTADGRVTLINSRGVWAVRVTNEDGSTSNKTITDEAIQEALNSLEDGDQIVIKDGAVKQIIKRIPDGTYRKTGATVLEGSNGQLKYEGSWGFIDAAGKTTEITDETIIRIIENLMVGDSVTFKDGVIVADAEDGSGTDKTNIPEGKWEVKREEVKSDPVPMSVSMNHFPANISMTLRAEAVSLIDSGDAGGSGWYLLGTEGKAKGCRLRFRDGSWRLYDSEDKNMGPVVATYETFRLLDEIRAGKHDADTEWTYGDVDNGGKFTRNGGGQGGGGQGSGMTGAPVPDGEYTLSNGRLRCADTGVILMKHESLGWMIINGENRNLVESEALIEKLEEALAAGKGVQIKNGKFVKFVTNSSGGNQNTRPSQTKPSTGGGNSLEVGSLPDGSYRINDDRTMAMIMDGKTPVVMVMYLDAYSSWVIHYADGTNYKLNNEAVLDYIKNGISFEVKGGVVYPYFIPDGTYTYSNDAGVVTVTNGKGTTLTKNGDEWLVNGTSITFQKLLDVLNRLAKAPNTGRMIVDGIEFRISFYLKGDVQVSFGEYVRTTGKNGNVTAVAETDKGTVTLFNSEDEAAPDWSILTAIANNADKKILTELDEKGTVVVRNGEVVSGVALVRTYSLRFSSSFMAVALSGGDDGMVLPDGTYIKDTDRNGNTVAKRDGKIVLIKLEDTWYLLTAITDDGLLAALNELKDGSVDGEALAIEDPNDMSKLVGYYTVTAYGNGYRITGENGVTISGSNQNGKLVYTVTGGCGDGRDTALTDALGRFLSDRGLNWGSLRTRIGNTAYFTGTEFVDSGIFAPDEERILPDGVYTKANDSTVTGTPVKGDKLTLTKENGFWYDADGIEIYDEATCAALDELLDGTSAKVVIWDGQLVDSTSSFSITDGTYLIRPTPLPAVGQLNAGLYYNSQVGVVEYRLTSDGAYTVTYLDPGSKTGKLLSQHCTDGNNLSVEFKDNKVIKITASNGDVLYDIETADDCECHPDCSCGAGLHCEKMEGGCKCLDCPGNAPENPAALDKLTGTYSYSDGVLKREQDGVELKEEDGVWKVTAGEITRGVNDTAKAALNTKNGFTAYQNGREYELTDEGWKIIPILPDGSYTMIESTNANFSIMLQGQDDANGYTIRKNARTNAWTLWQGSSQTITIDDEELKAVLETVAAQLKIGETMVIGNDTVTGYILLIPDGTYIRNEEGVIDSGTTTLVKRDDGSWYIFSADETTYTPIVADQEALASLERLSKGEVTSVTFKNGKDVGKVIGVYTVEPDADGGKVVYGTVTITYNGKAYTVTGGYGNGDGDARDAALTAALEKYMGSGRGDDLQFCSGARIYYDGSAFSDPADAVVPYDGNYILSADGTQATADDTVKGTVTLVKDDSYWYIRGDSGDIQITDKYTLYALNTLGSGKKVRVQSGEYLPADFDIPDGTYTVLQAINSDKAATYNELSYDKENGIVYYRARTATESTTMPLDPNTSKTGKLMSDHCITAGNKVTFADDEITVVTDRSGETVLYQKGASGACKCHEDCTCGAGLHCEWGRCHCLDCPGNDPQNPATLAQILGTYTYDSGVLKREDGVTLKLENSTWTVTAGKITRNVEEAALSALTAPSGGFQEGKWYELTKEGWSRIQFVPDGSYEMSSLGSTTQINARLQGGEGAITRRTNGTWAYTPTEGSPATIKDQTLIAELNNVVDGLEIGDILVFTGDTFTVLPKLPTGTYTWNESGIYLQSDTISDVRLKPTTNTSGQTTWRVSFDGGSKYQNITSTTVKNGNAILTALKKLDPGQLTADTKVTFNGTAFVTPQPIPMGIYTVKSQKVAQGTASITIFFLSNEEANIALRYVNGTGWSVKFNGETSYTAIDETNVTDHEEVLSALDNAFDMDGSGLSASTEGQEYTFNGTEFKLVTNEDPDPENPKCNCGENCNCAESGCGCETGECICEDCPNKKTEPDPEEADIPEGTYTVEGGDLVSDDGVTTLSKQDGEWKLIQDSKTFKPTDAAKAALDALGTLTDGEVYNYAGGEFTKTKGVCLCDGCDESKCNCPSSTSNCDDGTCKCEGCKTEETNKLIGGYTFTTKGGSTKKQKVLYRTDPEKDIDIKITYSSQTYTVTGGYNDKETEGSLDNAMTEALKKCLRGSNLTWNTLNDGATLEYDGEVFKLIENPAVILEDTYTVADGKLVGNSATLSKDENEVWKIDLGNGLVSLTADDQAKIEALGTLTEGDVYMYAEGVFTKQEQENPGGDGCNCGNEGCECDGENCDCTDEVCNCPNCSGNPGGNEEGESCKCDNEGCNCVENCVHENGGCQCGVETFTWITGQDNKVSDRGQAKYVSSSKNFIYWRADAKEAVETTLAEGEPLYNPISSIKSTAGTVTFTFDCDGKIIKVDETTVDWTAAESLSLVYRKPEYDVNDYIENIDDRKNEELDGEYIKDIELDEVGAEPKE